MSRNSISRISFYVSVERFNPVTIGNTGCSLRSRECDIGSCKVLEVVLKCDHRRTSHCHDHYEWCDDLDISSSPSPWEKISDVRLSRWQWTSQCWWLDSNSP